MPKDLGAQRIRVRNAEFVDDDQSLGPCSTCGAEVTRGVLGLTEVGETGGFAVAIPAPMEQVDGLPVADDSLLVLTKMMVDIAEAVPDVGLAVEIADLQAQDKGLTTVNERLVIVAQLSGIPAQVVEGRGLPCQVTGRPIVLEAVMGVVKGTLNSRVVVNLTVQDQQTQKTVWSEALIGTGSHRSGSIMAEDFIRPAFQAAMDNLISKLLHSDSFREAVQH